MRGRLIRISYWGIVLAILVIPLILIENHIGLYYDAVMPDYAATQIIFPSEYQESFFFSAPYLCQSYHGTVTMWISAVVIFFAEKTSALQHYIIGAVEIFLCLIILNFIFKNHKVDEKLGKSILLICAALPTVLSICVTQFYIELPGTLLSLVMILLLEKAEKAEGKNYLIFEYFGFFCEGLAFYSYFNFLFFAPGMLLLQWRNGESINIKIRNCLVGCCGIISGSVLYVPGYVQYLRGSYGQSLTDYLIPLGISLVILVGCGIIVLGLLSDKTYEMLELFFVMAVLGGTGFCYYYRGAIPNLLLSLGTTVKGIPVQGVFRVLLIWQSLIGALSGSTAESIVFSHRINGPSEWIFGMGLVFAVLVSVNATVRSVWKKHEKISYFVVIAIYLLCCLPLAGRMQTQHFIPLIFWIFLEIGIEADKIRRRYAAKSNYMSVLSRVCLIVIISSCLYLKINFVKEAYKSGGCGYYTKQINELAADALEAKQEGKKEIFLFPEWGFLTGFNYLTCNHVAFSVNCEKEDIISYLEQGFEASVLIWNDEKALEMIEKYTKSSNWGSKVFEFYEQSGSVVFYKISLTAI